MQPRDASQMPDFVASELQKCGLTLSDVPRWSFGSGPGSFTFLRVAAALGAGWAAANEKIRFRCLPGALALAKAMHPAAGERVGVIYDGRNRELLCFMVENADGKLRPTGEELILNAPDAQTYFAANTVRLAAFAKDAPALETLLADVDLKFAVLEADMSAFDDSDAAFDNDADKMVYIRPAVAAR